MTSSSFAILHNKMAVVYLRKISSAFLIVILVIRLTCGRKHHVELKVWSSNNLVVLSSVIAILNLVEIAISCFAMLGRCETDDRA